MYEYQASGEEEKANLLSNGKDLTGAQNNLMTDLNDTHPLA